MSDCDGVNSHEKHNWFTKQEVTTIISHGGMIIQVVEQRFVVAIRLSISFDFDTSHTSRPG